MHLLIALAAAASALLFLSIIFRPLPSRLFSASWQMAIVFLFIASPALAASPAPTSIHIDPATAQSLVNIAIALFLALGAMAWKWIDSRSPLKNTQAEDIARTAFMILLQKGAEYGATQMDSRLTKVGDIDVGNAAVAAGANFVMAHGPDLAKQLGVDITTPDGQAHIVQSITARVGTLLGNASAAQAPIYKIALPDAVLPPVTPATKPN